MTYSPSISLVLILGMAATAVAQGNQVQQQPFGISSGQPRATASQLEIRLSEPVDGQARLQFEGGVPGNAAVLLMSSRRSEQAGPAGSRIYLAAPERLTEGRFDRSGRFEMSLQVGDLAEKTFFQGIQVGKDNRTGSYLFQASHGLSLESIEHDCEVKPSDAAEPVDFSLFRIELGGNRSQQFSDGIDHMDLAEILRAALNSSGDSLQLQLTGKITVPAGVPGVAIGGKIALTATARRTNDSFEVSVAQDVALICGLKATEEVGLEGGRSVGVEAIHSYTSATQAARGIRSLALIMALGRAGDIANERSQRALHKARAARAAIHSRISRLTRILRGRAKGRARKALDRALKIRERAYRASRRAGAAAARAVAIVVDARNYLATHVEGLEMRTKCFGAVSVKVEADGLAGIGAEMEGARNVVVRFHGKQGQKVHKIDVSVTQTTKAKVEASLTVGFEAEREYARGIQLSFVRNAAGRFVVDTDDLFMSTGLQLMAFTATGYKQKLGLGRTTSLKVSLRDLGKNARSALMQAAAGKAKSSLQELAKIPATFAVQDRVVRALTAEFGGGAAGAAGKVGGSASWADQGPSRELTLTVPQMVDRMLHFDPVEAAKQLIGSFQEIRSTL